MFEENLLAKKSVDYGSISEFDSSTNRPMDDPFIQQEVDRRVAAALAKRERAKEGAPPPYTPRDPAAPTTQVMMINNQSMQNTQHHNSNSRLIALNDGPTCSDLCCCPCNTAKHCLSSTANCRECPCDAKCDGATLLACLKGCGQVFACLLGGN